MTVINKEVKAEAIIPQLELVLTNVINDTIHKTLHCIIVLAA